VQDAVHRPIPPSRRGVVDLLVGVHLRDQHASGVAPQMPDYDTVGADEEAPPTGLANLSEETGDLAHYSPGNHFSVFSIRGVRCGALI
jgi:hypothetical protein